MLNQLQYQQSAPSLLDAQRINQIKQAEKQRRIQYLHSIGVQDAATKVGRLRLAKSISTIIPILLSASTGYAVSGDDKRGLGTLYGTGIGAAASLVGRGIGSAAGSIAGVSTEDVKDKLNSIGLLDYLIPGIASYKEAQLEKDFLENENATRPQQHVF